LGPLPILPVYAVKNGLPGSGFPLSL
jgi:hypothetical protein